MELSRHRHSFYVILIMEINVGKETERSIYRFVCEYIDYITSILQCR